MLYEVLVSFFMYDSVAETWNPNHGCTFMSSCKFHRYSVYSR